MRKQIMKNMLFQNSRVPSSSQRSTQSKFERRDGKEELRTISEQEVSKDFMKCKNFSVPQTLDSDTSKQFKVFTNTRDEIGQK